MDNVTDIQSRLDSESEEKGGRPPASAVLMQMALDRYTLGNSTTGEAYAIPIDGPRVVSILRGSKLSLRGQLAKLYYNETTRNAPQGALADVMFTLEAMAQDEIEQELFLRAYGNNGTSWLDLGDHTGNAVKITADGWTIEESPPVLFKRTVLNSPLPRPERGGELDELWNYLNVTDSDKPLLAAWLVSTLYHEIPHPVLFLNGEQGTGKTTAHKVIVSIIDPSPVATRKPPRDSESWVTAAAGSWVVGIDNVSDIRDWLSDSICRAVTGEGDVRRKLYTDGDYSVFAFRRCICFNGIHLSATRGDLAERMLTVSLERIDPDNRRDEQEVWESWSADHPRILGAVLDLVARVKRELPSVDLKEKPRMADFACILAAVDKVMGTNGLAHYKDGQQRLSADSLSSSPFMAALMSLQQDFHGTSAELLARLAPEKTPKGWPANAGIATQELKRNAPGLRQIGWSIENDGAHNHSNVLTWTVSPQMARISPPHPSQHSQDMLNEPTVMSNGECGTICAACDGEGCRMCGDTGRNPEAM